MTKELADKAVDQMDQRDARLIFREWVRRNWADHSSVPLFDTTKSSTQGFDFHIVNTADYCGRSVLGRHPEMEALMKLEIRIALLRHAFSQNEMEPQRFLSRKLKKINLDWNIIEELKRIVSGGLERHAEIEVGGEDGISKVIRLEPEDTMEIDGIMYMMHTYDNGVIPKYIGITQLSNSGGYLNQTMDHNADSKFGRWGYSENQHLGGLSHAVLDSDKQPSKKYQRWADDLFYKNRILRKPVFFTAQTWEGNLEEAEELVVRTASKAYPDELLNVEYRDANRKLTAYG